MRDEYGLQIAGLLRALRETQATRARMEGKPFPNEGTLYRLRREERALEAKIAKLRQKEQDAHERRRSKAAERVERERRREAAKRDQASAQGTGKGLGRGKPMKRGSGPARQIRWNTPQAEARRKEREAARKEEQFSFEDGYHKWLTGLPCIRCNRPPPSEGRHDFMHVLGVDLGGKAEHALPGCRACHTWQEAHKVQFEAEFLAKHGITALEMARAMREAYTLSKREQSNGVRE